MSDLVLREEVGAVIRLTLNTPQNINALSVEMIAELSAALDEIAARSDIHAVILAGAGKAFCAGHNLRQMQEARADDDQGTGHYEALFADCAQMMQKVTALPQPVIAQVHGIATAAGCQLVASCDMAIAAEGTRFGVNGVNIGLFCTTPMVALSRAIPPRAAFEMLVTGDFITAERAMQLGLVNAVAAPEDLAEKTMEVAQKIAAKLPQAVRLGKAAFHRQKRLGLADAYDSAGETMCENVMLPDTAEGMAAFLEKRKPVWAQ